MYKNIDLIKDSFITSQSEEDNYGKDQLLEVGNIVKYDVNWPVRSLIKFDLSSSGLSSSSKYELHLYEAENSETNYDNFNIDIHSISQSWNEGNGLKVEPFSSSVSWNSASEFSSWNTTGGDYKTNLTSSVYFDTPDGDIKADVTELVNDIISGSSSNYGFLLKLRNESSQVNFNTKQFYSKQTNTVYKPKLYEKTNENLIQTGSYVDYDNSDEYVISLTNKKETYSTEEQPSFNFFIRKEQSHLRYDYTSSIYNMESIAFENLYYKISDRKTKETIIPFSEYSKCSYSGSQNYFEFDMSTLQKYRTYNLSIMVSGSNGHKRIYNDIHSFRVED